MARSSSSRPNRSTTPSWSSGSVWNGFAADRQKVTSFGSPAEATRVPSASTTATETSWTDSTSVPRVASIRNEFMAGET